MRPLQPTEEQLKKLLLVVSERIVAHQLAVGEAPASGPPHPDVDKLLDETLPEHGVQLEPLLDLVFGPLSQGGVNTVSPGNLSYVNGGGLFESALASFVTAAMNRYVTYWGAAPGLARLEQQVIAWFCSLVGYPTAAGGVLLTGGSAANFAALVTARETKLGEDFSRGVLYCSDQIHHSALKAARVAGIRAANVRVLPSDANYRLDPAALEQAMAEDRGRGLQPFLVIASAGTTNAGTVDDLAAVGQTARSGGAWFHVDAAYGGFFMLTERGREQLAGIGEADSIALDPHKSLFLPYGSGCLLVRDPVLLRKAHEVHSDYIGAIVAEAAADARPNFADYSLEMSREFRGLKVWLPLKLLGASAFRKALDEKLDLAQQAASRIRELPHAELLVPPGLSTVAFRFRPEGLPEAELDLKNERIVDHVNAAGRVHLSTTVMAGQFVIRVCVLSFRASQTAIDDCLADLRSAAREILGN